MDSEQAKQVLEARLRENSRLLAGELRAGETVLDCGEVNDLRLNTPTDLGAGEALLFVTNFRLILYRRGQTESWPYARLQGFWIKRAPRGIPQRGWLRELTVLPLDHGPQELVGGRMFLSGVHTLLDQVAKRPRE